MANADLNCPNCGAPVDFAGSTRATCSFCRSQLRLTGDGVQAAGMVSDLSGNRPVAPGVDLDEINELLLQDKKIEAIKLYREQTGVGLKEAKDAIEAIEATGWPPQPNLPGQTAADTTDRHLRNSNSALGCLIGCLPMLLFIGVCAGFVMLSSHIMFRAFGPLDQALRIINSDPAVVQAFGTPITPGVFVTGEMEGGGSSSSAQLSVPIYGPRRSGELNVGGSWRRGVWNLGIRVVYEDDGEEQIIYITQTVK